MVDVPVNIKFESKKKAIQYAKMEVARYIRKSTYRVNRDKYWSMDIMDYRQAWFVTMVY